MIVNFKSREAEKIFNRVISKKLPKEIYKRAQLKLWALNSTTDIKELQIPPSNRLELLKGNRKGQYSIRINNQWRLCFEWHNNHAYNVDIIDYHS